MYKQSEVLEIIMKKYRLEEGMKIDIYLIKRISYIEKIEIKDLMCMFQVDNITMYKLKKGIQKYTKLKFDKYNGIKNRKILKQEKVDYESFYNLKSKMNVRDYTLIRRLGISRYGYNKMKRKEVLEVRIKDIKTKHIVDLMKIDFKYLKKYGDRYYSIFELKEICKKRKISLNQFIKYYNNNPKHYKFNQMIIAKNKKGFWIGEISRIPDEFINKYYEEMLVRLNTVANKVSIIIRCKRFNEDLVHEAINELYEKCGNIIRNFYFDIEILFNILMSKAKYMMLNIYRKKYKTNNISYNSFENNCIDHIKLLRDDKYDPQLLLS